MATCGYCNWTAHDVSVHGPCCAKGHPVSIFGRDGQGRCRKCHSERAMAYYAKNRDAENARSRRYHAANRERIKARKRAKRTGLALPDADHPWRADATIG